MSRWAWLTLMSFAGCARPMYQQPALDAPHASVRVRLAYHSPPTTALGEQLVVGGQRLPLTPVRLRGESRDATMHFRIRPGVAAGWQMSSVFSHIESRMQMETYQEQYSCGSESYRVGDTTQTRTRYCSRTRTRQVIRNVEVVDASCEGNAALLPQVAANYIAQYDFYGHERCRLSFF
ncbi:MAG: hypothetical protein AAF645_24325, partial [Myxococcota bacterium]